MKARPSSLPLAQPRRVLSGFTELQRALLDELLDGYRAYRGSCRHKWETVSGDEAVVLEFLEFAGGVPGQVAPSDFERWSTHLFRDREVAASTQRKYQTAVRVFFDYVLREPKYRNRVRQALGADIVQVSTPENSVIHRRVRELEKANGRRSFTEEETAQFFATIEREIAYAWGSRSKALVPYQRDKAIFSTVLEMGLRAEETTSLNLDSFESNHEFPEFGDFGLCRVFGKGDKWRTVTVLDPALAEVLTWYVREIRPRLAARAAPGEKALFLSQKGVRLSYSSFLAQFSALRDLAGLPRELVPHCLRHTSVSNDDIGGLSLDSNRQRHGHVHAATTQGYMHHPDKFTKNEFGRIIRKKLRKTPNNDV